MPATESAGSFHHRLFWCSTKGFVLSNAIFIKCRQERLKIGLRGRGNKSTQSHYRSVKITYFSLFLPFLSSSPLLIPTWVEFCFVVRDFRVHYTTSFVSRKFANFVISKDVIKPHGFGSGSISKVQKSEHGTSDGVSVRTSILVGAVSIDGSYSMVKLILELPLKAL